MEVLNFGSESALKLEGNTQKNTVIIKKGFLENLTKPVRLRNG